MRYSNAFICTVLVLILGVQARAASAPAAIEVEWYPPEIEKGTTPDRSKVIVSGRTQAGSDIHIDGESITVLKPKTTTATTETEREMRTACKVYSTPSIRATAIRTLSKGEIVEATEQSSSWYKVNLGSVSGYISQPCLVPLKNSVTSLPPGDVKIESRDGKANGEGFFELALELPPGLSQMPVQVTTPSKSQKTFLISVDVNPVKEDIKINTKVSTKKPPAAAKRFRLWTGAGLTYQTYSQSTTGNSDLNFNTVQAPGFVARGGYWGEQWGFDLYFRDAPGKIEAAAPFQIQSDSYHWRTVDAKGLYQFRRGAGSRLLGLPAQWQLRFGGELQQIPFLGTAGNTVTIRAHSLTMGMLGVGLLLGQERAWSYEFALGYQQPISAKGENGTLTVSSPLAYEIQLGAAYKFAANWRLGVFSYIQSLAYTYELKDAAGVVTSGKQNLFYTTMDARLGYEF